MAQQILDISEICDILDKEVRPNTLSLGIDGAQKHTGICLLRTTKDKFYVEQFYGVDMKGVGKGNLHPKLIEYLHKCKEIRDSLPKYTGKYNKRVIIEDCYFGQSVWTTKVLAKYATVSFFVFRKWADEVPEPIQPVSARKRTGFEADAGQFHYELRTIKGEQKRRKVWDRKPLDLKDQIIDFIDKKFDLEIEDDNLADAFILALAGLIE